MNKNDLYMVVASYQNSIRNNLEIVDYNLTLQEAQTLKRELVSNHENGEVDEDNLIEDTTYGEPNINIVGQCEPI